MVINTYEKLHNPFVRLYYCILKCILSKFTQLNRLFRSERHVITSLYGQVCDLYEELLPLLSDGDPKNQLVYLNVRAGIFWSICGKDNSWESKFVREVKRNDKIPQKYSFPYYSWKRTDKEFGYNILLNLSVLYPVNVLCNQGYRKKSLISLAMRLPRIIKQDDKTKQQLDNEWRRLSRGGFGELFRLF